MRSRRRLTTTLRIDEYIWEEVKKAAVKNRMTLSDYFEEALLQRLKKDEGRKKK